LFNSLIVTKALTAQAKKIFLYPVTNRRRKKGGKKVRNLTLAFVKTLATEHISETPRCHGRATTTYM
jgi:hypothetical protein